MPMTCKIRHSDNIFYTGSGVFKNIFTGFDLLDLIHNKGFNNKKTFENAVIEMKEFLNDSMTLFYKYADPNDKHNITEVTIAGFEKGKPVLANLKWMLQKTSDTSFNVVSQLKMDRREFSIQFYGHFDSIFKFSNLHKNEFVAYLNRQDGFKKLIDMQAIATPKFVGGDVDQVEMYNDGTYKWIYKKQTCN
jgi:hypothetical protein